MGPVKVVIGPGTTVFSFLRRNVVVCTAGFMILLGPLLAGGQLDRQASDFPFLRPWFEVKAKERETLRQRGVVVRILPAHNRDIRVIAACAVRVTPAAFVARVRAAGDVKHTELSAGRFGEPPAVDDLATLSLDQGDIDRILVCRPGECRLNLSDEEMSALQRAFATRADVSSAEGQEAFRRMVLNRVTRYLAGGLEALPDYHDRPEPVRPDVVFAGLMQRSPYLTTHVPDVAAFLQGPPTAEISRSESLLLWSKVVMNKKPVVMVTHLGIFRPRANAETPSVLVVAKQVYASRYMDGELNLTMLFEGADGSPNYLVHVRRSDVDTLGGRFAPLKRAAIEGGVKSEAAKGLAALRDRLESKP